MLMKYYPNNNTQFSELFVLIKILNYSNLKLRKKTPNLSSNIRSIPLVVGHFNMSNIILSIAIYFLKKLLFSCEFIYNKKTKEASTLKHACEAVR